MKQLFLLRHAKSSWDDPALPDRDRPLAPRGRRDATALAAFIEAQEIKPSLVLCSPARRTTDTLRLITPAIGPAAELVIDDELYGAESGELLRRIRKVPDVASVMVIGHNPGIHELALMLARGVDDLHRLRTKFPTGALAILGVPGRWRDLGSTVAELQDFVVPKELDRDPGR